MGGHRKKVQAYSYFSSVKDFWSDDPVLPLDSSKEQFIYKSESKTKGLKKNARIKQEHALEKDGDIYSHDYWNSNEDTYLRKGPKRKK